VSNNDMQARMPWLKRTRPMYIALALTPMVVLTLWGVGEACSCPPEPTAAESLKIADAVFEGTIVDQRAYVSFEKNCTGPAIAYDVIVRRAWKGVFDRRVSLQRSSVCSPAFRVGETALIYAGRHNDEIFVRGCLPTKRIDWAEADVAQLGTPIATFPGHAVPIATAPRPRRRGHRRLRPHLR
jgi:hypothetical protein